MTKRHFPYGMIAVDWELTDNIAMTLQSRYSCKELLLHSVFPMRLLHEDEWEECLYRKENNQLNAGNLNTIFT